MSAESIHISQFIERPAAEVYAYASRPEHLPEWAAGLGGSIEHVDGRWIADSPMGRVTVELAPPNDFGVLDHDVTLEDGTRFYNPMRVIAAGDGRCEVVFTLRRASGVTDEEMARDEAAIRADLATLRRTIVG